MGIMQGTIVWVTMWNTRSLDNSSSEDLSCLCLKT